MWVKAETRLREKNKCLHFKSDSWPGVLWVVILKTTIPIRDFVRPGHNLIVSFFGHRHFIELFRVNCHLKIIFYYFLWKFVSDWKDNIRTGCYSELESGEKMSAECSIPFLRGLYCNVVWCSYNQNNLRWIYNFFFYDEFKWWKDSSVGILLSYEVFIKLWPLVDTSKWLLVPIQIERWKKQKTKKHKEKNRGNYRLGCV